MAQLANLKVISNVLHSNSEPGDFEMLIRHIVTGGQVSTVPLYHLAERPSPNQ